MYKIVEQHLRSDKYQELGIIRGVYTILIWYAYNVIKS